MKICTFAAIKKRTTTTPFDMVVRNEMDRFSLADDVLIASTLKVRKGLCEADYSQQVD